MPLWQATAALRIDLSSSPPLSSPGVEPPLSSDDQLKKIEERYWKEFEKNDLANVILLRGGRG